MARFVPEDVARKLAERIANETLDGYVDTKHGYTIRQIAQMLENDELVRARHGRWEIVGSDGVVCCSACGLPLNKTRVSWPDGSESGYYYFATNYCSHCGAKMEKGDCDG